MSPCSGPVWAFWSQGLILSAASKGFAVLWVGDTSGEVHPPVSVCPAPLGGSEPPLLPLLAPSPPAPLIHVAAERTLWTLTPAARNISKGPQPGSSFRGPDSVLD